MIPFHKEDSYKTYFFIQGCRYFGSIEVTWGNTKQQPSSFIWISTWHESVSIFPLVFLIEDQYFKPLQVLHDLLFPQAYWRSWHGEHWSTDQVLLCTWSPELRTNDASLFAYNVQKRIEIFRLSSKKVTSVSQKELLGSLPSDLIMILNRRTENLRSWEA